METGLKEQLVTALEEMRHVVCYYRSLVADGPYTYSKHLRYEGPGLDEKPDSLGVRELNIAFSEGKKVNEKWLKEYQFQLNAAHGQAPVAQGHDGNCVPVRTPDDGWKCDCGYAPVAPVRKWEAGEVVGERRCANPDCGTTLHVFMHNLSPEVQDALNRRKA